MVWPHLFTIKINFGFLLDGRILIKVEAMATNILALLYIQKWFENFMKGL